MSYRDFKKVHDVTTGRKRWRHYTGGPFYDSLQSIDPNNYIGTTGLGLKPKDNIRKITQDVNKESVDIGKDIISGLRARHGGGIKQDVNRDINNLQSRIKNLVNGSGLNI